MSKTDSTIVYPEELLAELQKSPKAVGIIKSMPPSHQKAYINYILEAKKSETRIKRAAKTIELLLQKIKD